MPSLFSKRLTIVCLISILVLTISACQAAAVPTSTPSQGASPTAAQQATSAAAQQPTLASAATDIPKNDGVRTLVPTQGDVTWNGDLGPGAFNMTELVKGLADLSSYTATLTLTFDGTQAGQPQKWSRTYVMITQAKPAARQLTIAQTGDSSDPADPAKVFLAEAEGVAYDLSGDNPCIANVIGSDATPAKQSEPAGFLSAVMGAEAAGSETVNGASVDAYKFDERALLGQAGIAKSTGEIWVAQKGGFIIKYVLSTKGGADFFGEGIDGKQTWDYELTGANQPVKISIPKECPAGLIDAPLLPGATAIDSSPGMLTFDTTTSLADAAAFYEEKIPTMGWKAEENEPAKPDTSDTSFALNFTQGDQTMSVTITSDQAGTSVQILLSR